MKRPTVVAKPARIALLLYTRQTELDQIRAIKSWGGADLTGARRVPKQAAAIRAMEMLDDEIIRPPSGHRLAKNRMLQEADANIDQRRTVLSIPDDAWDMSLCN